MKRRSISPAVALLITLAFIVLITILIVGLTTSMRIDRPAADTYFEKARAAQFAQTGVERVMGILQQYAAATSGNSENNWISQSGQLVVNNSGSTTLKTVVPLHSGAAPSTTHAQETLRPPNLNIITFREPATHLLTDLPDAQGGTSAAKMNVAWVYLRKDGSLDQNAEPDTTNKVNPIVGRYAYWTDDESSKVNYNIAWGRRNSNQSDPAGDLSKIELGAIFKPFSSDSTAAADLIHNAIAGGGSPYSFFNSPESARGVDPDVAKKLTEAKFDVTHYNHDPNTTFFNEERIVLTTRPDRAGWTWNPTKKQWEGINGKPSSEWTISNGKVVGGGRPIFLDIATIDAATGNPVGLSSWNDWNPWNPFATTSNGQAVFDSKRLARTIKVLNSYLSRTDWPIVDASGSGASFQKKYYGGKENRLTQLSLNVIDYVRTRESAGHPGGETSSSNSSAKLSATKIVIPIRGDHLAGQDFSLQSNAQSADAYLGVARAPRITEIGITIADAPMAINSGVYVYYLTVQVEVYLPAKFGLAELDLRNFKLGLQYDNPQNPGQAMPLEAPIATTTGEARTSDPILKAGEYRTIVFSGASTAKIRFNGPRPLSGVVGFRAYFSLNYGAIPPRAELCPLIGGANNADFIQLPYGAYSPNNIESREVDDPRVNSHKANWLTPVNGKLNTFGQANSISTIGLPSSTTPQQDTDLTGSITDASLYMPPPAGQTFGSDNNTAGRVGSVSELGYIHTGMESAAGAGVPWRTLRLQPNNQSTDVVPDWAFMDLFTAPVSSVAETDKYVYAPRQTAVGGRVNLNARPVPFSVQRTAPLAAVFQGCSYDSSDLAKKLDANAAEKIAQRIFKLSDPNTSDSEVLAANGKRYGYAVAFDAPGEVVEIKGVATGASRANY